MLIIDLQSSIPPWKERSHAPTGGASVSIAYSPGSAGGIPAFLPLLTSVRIDEIGQADFGNRHELLVSAW